MTWTCSTPNWPPGRTPPTRTSGKSTGTSPPATPGPNSATSTQNVSSDALLAGNVQQLDGRHSTHVVVVHAADLPPVDERGAGVADHDRRTVGLLHQLVELAPRPD